VTYSTQSAQQAACLEFADDFGLPLSMLMRAYRGIVASTLDDLPNGVRGYLTLDEVVRGEHPTQLALATNLGIDRTVMTYVIDDLVDAGLVERQLNPADRRQRKIVPTAAGRRALVDLRRRVREAEGRLLEPLHADERALFRDLLKRVARGLSGTGLATCDEVAATAMAGPAGGC
jgi:DNA-binding MarR family transcriptional regulator